MRLGSVMMKTRTKMEDAVGLVFAVLDTGLDNEIAELEECGKVLRAAWWRLNREEPWCPLRRRAWLSKINRIDHAIVEISRRIHFIV